MALQKGIVKSVLSGDTVILRGRPRGNGPPPERQVNLSFVSAPRMASVKKETKDEPFAFESRNFLRTLVVGKEATFRINHTASNSGLEFGTLYLAGQSRDVASLCVQEGWCRVRAEAKRSHVGGSNLSPQQQEQLEEYCDRLLDAEAEAKANCKGIWSISEDDEPIVPLERPTAFHGDAHAFLAKYRGKPLDAIVEQIREGSTFRLLVMLPNRQYPTQYQTLIVFLSGIKCPIVRKGIPGVEDLVEPFGEEAKFFVESRLLQRDVKVIVEGVAGTNQNFIGSIRHPAGNIAELLVANGLARCVEWSLNMVTDGPAKLRAGEQVAKRKQLRLWRDYEPEALSSANHATFDAKMIKIVTADTLLVRNSTTGKEEKVHLSSIRQPKSKDRKDAYFHHQAKEFLRKQLIGQTVQVRMDFIRPANEDFDARPCGTVMHDGMDVAEALVSQGLAGVVRYRKDDNNRALHYDQLLVAEKQAMDANRGIHDKKTPPVFRINDVSETHAKARQFLPSLRRSGRIPAVVDHVANGGRFKIILPKENTKLTFILAGIRAPRVGRTSEDGSEPFALEAQAFAVDRCLQRDVEIEVDTVDKSGGFIGTLWLNHDENFALALLEQGLAQVHEHSANQSTHAKELFSKERAAKAAGLNLWRDQQDNDSQSPKITNTTTASQAASIPLVGPTSPTPNSIANSLAGMQLTTYNPEYVDVVVSEITVANRFYVQLVRDAIPGLENLMAEFALYHMSSAAAMVPPHYVPRLNGICSAQFTVDNQWYRARVVAIPASNQATAAVPATVHVYYLDYGNSEVLPVTRIRPIPDHFLTLPAQAHEATLAMIEMPKRDKEYGKEAYDRLRGSIEHRPLVAVVESRSRRDGTYPPAGETLTEPLLQVTLYDPMVSANPEASVNADMVRAGLALVKNDDPLAHHNPRQFNHLQRCQEEAKQFHYGMFEYGDIMPDEN